MALTRKNWTVNSYTNDVWVDLVAEPATIATVIISNTTVGNVDVSARLQDGGNGLATVLPTKTLQSNEAYVVGINSLNVTGTQTLQVQANAAGAEFIASGVI